MESTVTSEAVGITINKLLLRKVKKFLRSSKVSVLSTSGGTESPARSTSALVLDRVDTTVFSPVDSGIVFAFFKEGWLHLFGLRDGAEPSL